MRSMCTGRTLIGVVDQPVLRLVARDRHRQCVPDQLGRHLSRHRPAHDPTAPDVHHDREVEPTGRGGHVRDVSHPEAARPIGRELPGHQVRSSLRPGLPLRRRALEAPACHPLDPHLPHQPRHPLAAHPLALVPQRRMDPRTAVDLLALAPDPPDPAPELRVPPLPRRMPPPKPIAVPAGGVTQHPAHGCNRENGPVWTGVPRVLWGAIPIHLAEELAQPSALALSSISAQRSMIVSNGSSSSSNIPMESMLA